MRTLHRFSAALPQIIYPPDSMINCFTCMSGAVMFAIYIRTFPPWMVCYIWG